MSDDNFEATEGKSSTTFDSKTEAWTLQTKFFIPEQFFNIDIDFFSSLGLELTHRSDVLAYTSKVGGVFGAGLSYDINPRFTSQLYFNYHTGYGSLSVYPCEDDIPFIYQINLALLIKIKYLSLLSTLLTLEKNTHDYCQKEDAFNGTLISG